MNKSKPSWGLIPCVIVVYVALVYAFFPTYNLNVTTVPITLFHYLTDGFLAGHLSLSIAPSPELLNLADPYDPRSNAPFRLYDASLFHGKYYLYFGPLPVLTLYLPLRFLTGYFPTDGFATAFFSTLAFIINLLLLIRIKWQHFPKASETQLILFAFFLAFANGTPFLLSLPRVYEAAMTATFCCLSMALYFLYKSLQDGYRMSDIFCLGLFLSFTAAGRQQFGVICFFIMVFFSIFLLKNVSKEKAIRRILLLLFPGFIVASLLILYNYLRFGSFFDTGHYWQLSCNNIHELYEILSDIRKIPRNIWFGFYYYFLQPYTLSTHFPFVVLTKEQCNHFVDKDFCLETIAGILTTIPCLFVLFCLPEFRKGLFNFEDSKRPLIWFMLFVAFIALFAIVFLLILPFAIHRYEMDFVPYLVLLSPLTFWLMEDKWHNRPWFPYFRFIFNVTLMLSILIGISLGFAYWEFN